MTFEVILIAIVLFMVLILFHELGHFLVAKLMGMRVHEFSIGMGPLLAARRRGDTLYSLRMIPLGGFNRIAGMEPEDMGDPQGFNTKSVAQRMAVISAGSLMNFALAIVFIVAVFLFIGVPSNSTVVGRVLPGHPAEMAGLLSGDRIIAVDGQAVSDWSGLVSIIYQHPEQEVELTVTRGDSTFTTRVTPRLDPETGTGRMGIERVVSQYDLIASLGEAFRQAGSVLYLIVTSLGNMILGKAPVDLVGPVGIVRVVGEAARFGLFNVLGLAAFISLNLGLINLLPIPALDGSRLIFLAVEGLRGKPIDPRKENVIHLVGFALLIGVFLVVTYFDLLRIFNG